MPSELAHVLREFVRIHPIPCAYVHTAASPHVNHTLSVHRSHGSSSRSETHTHTHTHAHTQTSDMPATTAQHTNSRISYTHSKLPRLSEHVRRFIIKTLSSEPFQEHLSFFRKVCFFVCDVCTRCLLCVCVCVHNMFVVCVCTHMMHGYFVSFVFCRQRRPEAVALTLQAKALISRNNV